MLWSLNLVEKTKSNLSPTYLGLAITQLLENHFTTLVDKNFTAKMENELDAISRGELEPAGSVLDKIEENQEETPKIPENNN